MALEGTARQDIGSNERASKLLKEKRILSIRAKNDMINLSYTGRYPRRLSILITRSERNSNFKKNATNQSPYQVV